MKQSWQALRTKKMGPLEQMADGAPLYSVVVILLTIQLVMPVVHGQAIFGAQVPVYSTTSR